jgi:type III pantothenate kinase
MLLTIDIGNTNTTVGIFDNDRLVDYYRLTSREMATSDEVGLRLSNICQLNNIEISAVDATAVCSVVPVLTSAYAAAINKYFKVEPLIVTYETELGLKIDYEIPNQVGADRLADAVAAFHHYGGPTIIVDLGTAITVDAVSADGCYLGGAIAPGIEASVEGLSRRASQLFQVPLRAPAHALGKNTVESIQAGTVFGAVGQIDELVTRISQEIGEPIKQVIGTGGLANLILGISKTVNEINQTLTLEGLKIIYTRLKRKSAEEL